MNFRKVRRRKQPDGHIGRSWERGFLSADCGDMAPDDIGYLPLYKPDIEGRDSAICDYVFNETVLVYSHDNIRNFGSMVTDYLNIWTTLWLAGLSRHTRDISLLNIDHMKRGKAYGGDAMNQFFRTYNVSFRRILRGVDFIDSSPTGGQGNQRGSSSGSKLCFKRLIVQPRPVLPFQPGDNSADDISTSSFATTAASAANAGCSQYPVVSSIFQRWNLQIRNNYGLLNPSVSASASSLVTTRGNGRGEDAVLQVLLITRSLRATPAGVPAEHQSQRLFRNQAALVQGLETFLATFPLLPTTSTTVSTSSSSSSATGSTTAKPTMRLVVQDLASLSFDEQVRLVSASQVLVGMHGVGVAMSVFMPVGSAYCCGVLEIFPNLALVDEGSIGLGSGAGRGYGPLARRLGHVYDRLDLLPSTSSSAAFRHETTLNVSTANASITSSNAVGTEVPVDRVVEALGRILNDIVKDDGGRGGSRISSAGSRASCLLEEVVRTPYL